MNRIVLALLATMAAWASAGLRVASAASSAAAAAASSAAAAAAAGAQAAASTAALPDDDRPVFAWWPLLTNFRSGAWRQLLHPSWWVAYVEAEFRAEPAHVLVEAACIATILYLLLIRKPAPPPQEVLTKKEEEELIAEWKPEPLCPPSFKVKEKQRFIVESVTGRTVVANGSTFLNFASTSFLGMADRADIKAACRTTIEKYGVGSCGPRGFYGTFDVHLAVESALARFMRAEECILYSDSIACVSSVIPAFAKRGDTVVLDDACSFGMQQGALLSRSKLVLFKHGDMASLEAALKQIDEQERKRPANTLHRKFIVVEGVSSVYGDIVDLPRVLQLKAQYKYRLIVEDSLGFGVLGASGRGTLEHFDAEMQGPDLSRPGVDILCAGLDSALGSVGGFCVGNRQVVDHQRLSGAGYCFSASSPPYTSTASIEALALLEQQGSSLCAGLRRKAHKARRALAAAHPGLVVLGNSESIDSPVIHVGLKRSDPSAYADEWSLFESLSASLRESARLVAHVPEFIPADATRAQPNIRFVITTQHTDADIDKLAKAVANAANQLLRR